MSVEGLFISFVVAFEPAVSDSLKNLKSHFAQTEHPFLNNVLRQCWVRRDDNVGIA